MTEIEGAHWVPGMRSIKRIHFIGIGGAGMCGLAEVLLNQGYKISGSDVAENANVQRLTSLGAAVHVGHDAAHALSADVVVVSAAIAADNPELQAASDNRIPVVARAEMLSEIMRYRYGVAVAGTHGKTTTTSLVATLLGEAGLDPTFVIGGLLNSAGVHARLGASPYLVAEADESDASFLHLQPQIAVVTNIEADHMGTYHGSMQKLRDTFIEFLHNLPFYGLAVLCIDDPEVRALLPKVNRPYLTYGLAEDADIRAVNVIQTGFAMQFDVRYQDELRAEKLSLNMPGTHNVQNALAAIAVASEVNVPIPKLSAGLQAFQGVGRRFQIRGTATVPAYEGLTFIDDYGHHPSEVDAIIQAIRGCGSQRRLVMVFQPHRYSRTVELYEDFVRVLSQVDVLLMLDVYAAGEAPIEGASAQALCRSIRVRGAIDPIHVANTNEMVELLPNLLQPNDILVTQGAGSVGRLADGIEALLSL